MQNIGFKEHVHHGPLSRYVKLRVAHAPGMPGTFSPPPRVSDLDMHHGTCVMHVPWGMPRSPTILCSRWRGEKFLAFPAHAQPAILRICQEDHRFMWLPTILRHHTNVYWSYVGFRSTLLRTIPREVPKISVCKMNWNIPFWQLLPQGQWVYLNTHK